MPGFVPWCAAKQWKESGLTTKEFAAQAGVDLNTLQSWKWRLTADARRSMAARPRHRYPLLTIANSLNERFERAINSPHVIQIKPKEASAFGKEKLARALLG